MIKIDKSPRHLDPLGAHLGAAPSDPAAEIFCIEGCRTWVGGIATSPPHEAGVQIAFRPADPAAQNPGKQGTFSEAERDNILCLLASPDGRFGSLRINADVRIYTCKLGTGHRITFYPRPGHQVRILLSSGALDLLGHPLTPPGVASIAGEPELAISARAPSEFLMLELG